LVSQQTLFLLSRAAVEDEDELVDLAFAINDKLRLPSIITIRKYFAIVKDSTNKLNGEETMASCIEEACEVNMYAKKR